MISPGTTISSSSPVSSHILNSTSYEIDKIIARIEHDNRVLAELEKSRVTVGMFLVFPIILCLLSYKLKKNTVEPWLSMSDYLNKGTDFYLFLNIRKMA